MRSFGVTSKRLQHAWNFSEEPFSAFVSWIRNRMAHIVGGVQPVGVTLADFSSMPKYYLARSLTMIIQSV